MAADNPKTWHKHLGFVLWAIRETPHSTTGVPPALLAWGRVSSGPLAILKDTMTGKVKLPLNLEKTASEYLDELRKNVELAQDCGMEHTDKAQRQYISRYNLRAKEKSFEVGQHFFVLTPDSTSSKTFSRWVGPAVIKERLSNHTYSVEINGSVKHIVTDVGHVMREHACREQTLASHLTVSEPWTSRDVM